MQFTLSCPTLDSFRVQQVAGMFDVPIAERLTETFEVELPAEDEAWQVGLIVGPSGSGKSSVAQHAFHTQLYQGGDWPADRAVVDGFGDLPVRKITELLTAVGFSSPPSWIKPYAVLSNGERFRCDLARSLAISDSLASTKGVAATANQPPLVVFDEFTSVVDRDVAKVCSAAVAKAVRSGRVEKRFVAVTCHYDVADWLEPDWVLDMATGELTRRCLRQGNLQRPAIELQVHRCKPEAWRLFARHHYLSGSLNPTAECYLTTWNGKPVNFCATLPVIGFRGRRRFTRVVTLPDFQGIGIGTHSIAAVAELHRQRGHRVSITSSHPGLILHCQSSPKWKAVSVKKTGQSPGRSKRFANYRSSTGRAVVSFEWQDTAPIAGNSRSDSKQTPQRRCN